MASFPLVRFVWNYRLSLSLIAIILTACLITVPQTKLSGVQGIDKVVHTLMFLCLTLVIWLEASMLQPQRVRLRRTFLIIGTTTIALGGLIEVLQGTLTAHRSADWLDFWADGAGVVLGQMVGTWIYLRSSKSIHHHA